MDEMTSIYESVEEALQRAVKERDHWGAADIGYNGGWHFLVAPAETMDEHCHMLTLSHSDLEELAEALEIGWETFNRRVGTLMDERLQQIGR